MKFRRIFNGLMGILDDSVSTQLWTCFAFTESFRVQVSLSLTFSMVDDSENANSISSSDAYTIYDYNDLVFILDNIALTLDYISIVRYC